MGKDKCAAINKWLRIINKTMQLKKKPTKQTNKKKLASRLIESDKKLLLEKIIKRFAS